MLRGVQIIVRIYRRTNVVNGDGETMNVNVEHLSKCERSICQPHPTVKVDYMIRINRYSERVRNTSRFDGRERETKGKERTLRASFAKKDGLKESRIIMGVLNHRGQFQQVGRHMYTASFQK
jgi:hypothetical protein